MTPRPLSLTFAAFALALPAAGHADRIAPLAPPALFNPLTVPMTPVPPGGEAPRRVTPPAPPVVTPVPNSAVPAPTETQSEVAPPPEPQPDSGADLIERGAGMIFENLLREMQPAVDDMAQGLDSAIARFGPTLKNIGQLIDDIGNYEAPERLPNGDVLIRRRADAPPPPPLPQLGDPQNGQTGPDTANPPDSSPTPPASEPPALANPVPQIDL